MDGVSDLDGSGPPYRSSSGGVHPLTTSPYGWYVLLDLSPLRVTPTVLIV